MGTQDAAIKSIVNEYHWPPKIIDTLFCDDLDYYGITYWYNNLKELHDSIPKK